MSANANSNAAPALGCLCYAGLFRTPNGQEWRLLTREEVKALLEDRPTFPEPQMPPALPVAPGLPPFPAVELPAASNGAANAAREGTVVPRNPQRENTVKEENLDERMTIDLTQDNSEDEKAPEVDAAEEEAAEEKAIEDLEEIEEMEEETEEEEEIRRTTEAMEIDFEHFCDEGYSCIATVYELLDSSAGEGWTDPSQPPPSVGQWSSDEETGDEKAWWCRHPHAWGDYCISGKRLLCPGCNNSKHTAGGKKGCFKEDATFYIRWDEQAEGYAIFQKSTGWKALAKDKTNKSGNVPTPRSHNGIASRLVKGLLVRGHDEDVAASHGTRPFRLLVSKKVLNDWANEDFGDE